MKYTSIKDLRKLEAEVDRLSVISKKTGGMTGNLRRKLFAWATRGQSKQLDFADAPLRLDDVNCFGFATIRTKNGATLATVCARKDNEYSTKLFPELSQKYAKMFVDLFNMHAGVKQ